MPLSAQAVDLVIAAVVAVFTGADAASNAAGYRQADWVTWLLYAVSVGALLVRSRWPVAVALVTGAGCAGWALYGHIGELLNLPVMVALYAVAVTGGRRRTLWTAGVTATVSGIVSMIAGIDVVQPQGAPLLEMLWPLVPLLLGEVVRGRRELMAEYADRAARAEAERDREARLRVARERVRIARELHDVVAHSVSAMTVHAALALDALDTQPETARQAMRQVRASGKEAARELRAAVGVLRQGEPDAEPAPRLAELADLAERVRATGLRVALRTPDMDPGDAGGSGELPSLVELAVYRIVQEALTNVLKHADALQVAVSVVRDGDGDEERVVVEVVDDGTRAGRAGPAGDGYGLIGMRERAAGVGGTLVAGPAAGGGWQVSAVLPVHGAGAGA